MGFETWLVFIAVSAASAFSPGPGLLLAISNASRLGARKALTSSAGNVFGLFLMSCAATLGLGALLKTSVILFFALKLLGAGYLIYLGIRQWLAEAILFKFELQPKNSFTAFQLFRQGFLVACTNPKSILYFTALFPQFIDPRATQLVQFAILSVTFLACVTCSHFVYIFGAEKVRVFLSSQNRIMVFNRCLGCLFIVLGISLIFVS